MVLFILHFALCPPISWAVGPRPPGRLELAVLCSVSNICIYVTARLNISGKVLVDPRGGGEVTVITRKMKCEFARYIDKVESVKDSLGVFCQIWSYYPFPLFFFSFNAFSFVFSTRRGCWVPLIAALLVIVTRSIQYCDIRVICWYLKWKRITNGFLCSY